MERIPPDPPGSPPYLEGFMRDRKTGEWPKRMTDEEFQAKVDEFEKGKPYEGFPEYTWTEEPLVL